MLNNNITPYFNGVYFAIACVIIYFNSPFHYKKQRITNFLNSLILSQFLVSIGSNILTEKIQNFGGVILFLLVSLGIGYLLNHAH